MWGLYFGIILIIEKLFLLKIIAKAEEKISNLEKNNKALGKILSIILSAFSHIYAMFLVLIGWVIFAFEDLSKVGAYLSSMFGLNNISFVNSEAIYYLQNYFIIIIVGIICSIPLKNIAIKTVEKIKKIKAEKTNDTANIATVVNSEEEIKKNKWTGVITGVLCVGILIISTASLVNNSFNPFLYFRFSKWLFEKSHKIILIKDKK